MPPVMAMRPVEASAQELLELAFSDDLTGLRNRRYFYHYLSEKIEAAGPQPQPLALCLIDLDSLKPVNDTLGHVAGDRLLARVAHLIRDTVGDEGLAVRYAGDEFAIVLPGRTVDEAVALGERVRERVASDPFSALDLPPTIRPTLSAGVAVFPHDATGCEELVDVADQALYASKRAGKNRVTRAGSAASAAPTGRSPTAATTGPGAGAAPPRAVDRTVTPGRAPRPTADPGRGSPLPVARPLIGRDAAVFEAMTALDRLTRREPGLALLFCGPSGRGKSRMCREVARLATSRGLAVTAGGGHEADRGEPFRAFARLIDKVLGDDPVMRRRVEAEVAPFRRAVLTEILSEISADRSDAIDGAASDDESETLAAVRGMTDVLAVIGRVRPTVLILDDLEHADRGSLSVIVRWVETRGRGVLLVGSANAALGGQEWSEAAKRIGARRAEARIVELSALDRPRTSALIASSFRGSTPPDAVVDRVFTLTRGEPVHIEAAARSLSTSGGVVLRPSGDAEFGPGAAAGLPASREQLVEADLAATDGPVRELLEQASVIGKRFDLELLRRVVLRSEGEALDLLEEARRLHLLRDALWSAGADFEFASPQHREHTYRRTDPYRRRRTHLIVAQALAARLGSDATGRGAALIAWHSRQGGDLEAAADLEAIVAARRDRLTDLRDLAAPPEPRPETDADGSREGGSVDAAVAVELVAGLAAAVRAHKLYPPGSRSCRDALATLARRVGEAHAEASAITLTADGPRLACNGQPLRDPAPPPVATRWLIETLTGGEASSLTIAARVSRDSLASLVAVLAETRRGPEGRGQADLEGRLGELVRVSATAAGAAERPRATPPPAPVGPAPGPRAAPADDALSPPPASSRPPAVDLFGLPPEQLVDRLGRLVTDERLDVARSELERLGAALAESARRGAAAERLGAIIDRAPPALRDTARSILRERLGDALGIESDEARFDALLDLADRAVPALLARGDVAGATRIIWAAGRRAREGLVERGRPRLERWLGGASGEPIWTALAEGTAAEREAAQTLLEGAGDAALPGLVALARRPLSPAGETAVRSLARVLGIGAAAALAAEITPTLDEASAARLLDRALAAGEGADAVLRRAASATLPGLRATALTRAAELDPKLLVELAGAILTDAPTELRVVALDALGSCRTDAARDLILATLATDDGDDDVARACCVALGRAPDARAVDPLIAIARGEASGGVREASAWALGQQADPRARSALEALAAGDDALAATARLLLADGG